MPWALLIVGAMFATLTLHSLRPLRWPGSVVLGAWFATWLTIELPVHIIIAELVAGVALATTGGLDAWPGAVGLGLIGISALGQVRHIALARTTERTVETALAAGLGDDYRDHVVQSLRSRFASAPKARSIATVWPFKRPDVERIRNIAYHTEGRHKLELDIYRHESAPANAPVLVYVHGGGWVIGNKGQQGLVTVNHLASRGWVCASINYRLSPRATFPDHLVDVKRAIRWVKANIANYGGDPSFVMIAGGSAGAHLSALATLTPNDVEYQREFPDADTSIQGCVGFYGVYDWTDRFGHWPHGGFRLLLERIIMKRRFRDAHPDFDKASPMSRVHADAPPFFLLHGDRDNLAPVGEARQFSDALRNQSRSPVAYAELRGAQHAFELFPSVRSVHAIHAVERFCAWTYSRHLAAHRRQQAA